tara:strand:- start:43 stop:297 length:255 start_codon:yes stop_codon:yes gene_type:complete
MDKYAEDLEIKVVDIIDELFEEHEKYGPEFMISLFLSGLTNVLATYALNENSAKDLALEFGKKLLWSVKRLKEEGEFKDSEHIQ